MATRGQLPQGVPVAASSDWASFAQTCPHAPDLPQLNEDEFTANDPLCQMAKCLIAKASAIAAPPPILSDFTPFLGNAHYWKARDELDKQECPKEALDFTGLPAKWTFKQAGGTAQVDPQTAEYKLVEATFFRTFSNTEIRCQVKGSIIVYRIEHPKRWQRYQQGVAGLSGCKEYWTFHGSSKGAIHSIIQGDGVDPSRIRMGAFGRGSYFALKSCYSHSYAKPDERGERHMLLCRVAMKEAEVGNSSMTAPTPGRDTTCDPQFTIFCKFDPSHIYESYVISYSV